MKVYRGAARAARNYVEADRSRADDYYLAEGSGLAMRFTARRDAESRSVVLQRRADMDGDAYEQWVAGYVETGRAKGRLRKDDQAVRFVEVTVNGPKTWSLAAGLHDDIAAAYDAAQIAAAEEIIGWLAAHATTSSPTPSSRSTSRTTLCATYGASDNRSRTSSTRESWSTPSRPEHCSKQ